MKLLEEGASILRLRRRLPVWKGAMLQAASRKRVEIGW